MIPGGGVGLEGLPVMAFGLVEPSLLLYEPAEPMVSGRGAAPIVELQEQVETLQVPASVGVGA
jgi:hypothetical protein